MPRIFSTFGGYKGFLLPIGFWETVGVFPGGIWPKVGIKPFPGYPPFEAALQNFPFTPKVELRGTYPYGLMACKPLGTEGDPIHHRAQQERLLLPDTRKTTEPCGKR